MSVLRATGSQFDPNAFLTSSALQPCNVFIKGQRRSESDMWDLSGLTVATSDSEIDDFQKQLTDSIEFLISNRAELLRLKSFEGVDDVRLDFGVGRRPAYAQYYFFPPELVALANEFGMGLEISIYGRSE